jgi:hypothetical protein
MSNVQVREGLIPAQEIASSFLLAMTKAGKCFSSFTMTESGGYLIYEGGFERG